MSDTAQGYLPIDTALFEAVESSPVAYGIKKKITWIYNYVPPFKDPYGEALFTPILVETAMITTGS